ncbi:MAG: hypothetical protein DRP16_02515 [Candidatus Aenigmatarchaeota archaeon]|nr:MAG: hypothetical protein DRP16_02515 [Candidatus Aenigmarchaeota archaeon]
MLQKLTGKERENLIKLAKKKTIRSLRQKYKLSRYALIGCLNEAVEKGVLSPEEYKSFIFRSIRERRLKNQRKFPRHIEDRLESVLSCVNSETKQITLTLLDETPMTTGAIKSLYNYVTGGVWDINSTNFATYCRRTFLPIGAVAEEVIIFDDRGRETTGWSLNEAGKRYAKPIARFCLKKANEYEISFYEIFGASQSPGDFTAPLNTVYVLSYLLEKKDAKRKDMIDWYGFSEMSISSTFQRLKKAGLVEGESISPEEPWQIYEWDKGKPDEVKPVRGCKRFAKDVAEIVYKLKKAGINDVFEKLKDRGYKPGYTRGNVSSILSGLVDQGFLKRGTEFIGGKKQCLYKLTYKGKEFARDVVGRIENALKDGNELKYMHEISKDIFGRSYLDDCGYGVLFYKEIAPPLKRKSSKKRTEEIRKIIEENPGIRQKQIKEKIGVNPINYLCSLVNKGEVYKKKRGRCAKYYLARNKNEILKNQQKLYFYG